MNQHFKQILNFKTKSVNVPVEPIVAGVNIVAVPSLHMVVHLSGTGVIRYNTSLPVNVACLYMVVGVVMRKSYSV